MTSISIPLGDICRLITDGKHGDCKNEEDSGFFFISAKDIKDSRIHYENARQIVYEDFLETHRRTNLQPGDILLTNSGTIGRLAIAPDEEITYKTTFQKSVAILKPILELINSKYLYYFLLNKQTHLENAARGAAQKNLLLSELRRFNIQVPSKVVQNSIVSILSPYDDLIENNRRRIQLLEETARLLYQEWFVRLRFPGHEHTKIVDGVPEGWESLRLIDVLELQRGFDLPLKNIESGNVPVYGSTGIIAHHNVSKAKGPGIITGRSGSLGVVQYVQNDYWPHNTALWVKSFKKVTPLFTLQLLRNLKLEQYNGGVSVPTLDRKVVHRIQIIIPPKKLMDEFESISSDSNALMINLSQQNSNLVKARNLLLPRLMNGVIPV